MEKKAQTSQNALTLRVLVIRQNGYLIAQGLERDIAAQAETIEELVRVFGETVRAEALRSVEQGLPPLGDVPRAPSYFFERWEQERGAEMETSFTIDDLSHVTSWRSEQGA